jgi:hypothetical protein
MNTDDPSPSDFNPASMFGTNGDAADDRRPRGAPESGSPGKQGKTAHLSAGQKATDLEIVAFSNVGQFRFNPETFGIEVIPGVSPNALRAVESASVRSETSTVEQDGETITTTTTTTVIRLRDKLAALESLAAGIRTAGPSSPDSPPSDMT